MAAALKKTFMPRAPGLHVRSHRAYSARLCGKGTLLGFHPGGGKLVVVPMTCKSWDCPRCQPVKTRRWIEVAEFGKPERFITLTCDSTRFETAEEAALFMMKKFTKLAEKIRKTWGEFEYLRVWELHKSGYPHIHLLSRGVYIPQKWLSEQWEKLGVGKVVDIRKIKNPKITAKYVMKYMGKTVGKLAALWAGIRIITKSQRWLPKGWTKQIPPGMIEYEWQMVKDPYWRVLADLDNCNCREISFNAFSFRAEITIDAFAIPKGYDGCGAAGHVFNRRREFIEKEIAS